MREWTGVRRLMRIKLYNNAKLLLYIQPCIKTYPATCPNLPCNICPNQPRCDAINLFHLTENRLQITSNYAIRIASSLYKPLPQCKCTYVSSIDECHSPGNISRNKRTTVDISVLIHSSVILGLNPVLPVLHIYYNYYYIFF